MNREQKIEEFAKAIKEEDIENLLYKFEVASVDAITDGNLSIERNPFGITLTKSIYIDEQD